MNDGQYGPARAYLHVGLTRSGTTFLQRLLTRHRAALRLDGMLFPGATDRRGAEEPGDDEPGTSRRVSRSEPGWDYSRQVTAAREAVDLPGGLKAAELAGAWDALVDELDGWHGHRAIVSVEHLSLARPAQIRAITASLQPAEVHVVLTVRDIVRVVPSAWQDTIQNGLTWTWDEYLAALTDPGDTPGPAQRFWRSQDVLDTVDRWAGVVGVDHVHVVPVPPAGAPPEELWHRFCQAVGLNASRYPLDETGGPVNASLDGDAVEMLRRLNLRLAGQLEPAQYQRLVKRPLARGALAQVPVEQPIRLPAELHGWFVQRTAGVVDGLLERGVRVTGDLRDLVSPEDAPDLHLGPGDAPESAHDRDGADAPEGPVLDAAEPAQGEPVVVSQHPAERAVEREVVAGDSGGAAQPDEAAPDRASVRRVADLTAIAARALITELAAPAGRTGPRPGRRRDEARQRG